MKTSEKFKVETAVRQADKYLANFQAKFEGLLERKPQDVLAARTILARLLDEIQAFTVES